MSCSSFKKISNYSSAGQRVKCVKSNKTKCINFGVSGRCNECPGGGGPVDLDRSVCELPIGVCATGWPNIPQSERYYALVAKGEGSACTLEKIEFPCQQLSQLFTESSCNINFNFTQNEGVFFPPTSNTTYQYEVDGVTEPLPLEEHCFFYNLLNFFYIQPDYIGPPQAILNPECFDSDGLYHPPVTGNYIVNLRLALEKKTGGIGRNSGKFGIFIVQLEPYKILRFTIGQAPNDGEVPTTLDLTTVLRLEEGIDYAFGFNHNQGDPALDFTSPELAGCTAINGIVEPPPLGPNPDCDPVVEVDGNRTIYDCDTWPTLDKNFRSWISITRLPDFDPIITPP